MIIAAQNLKRLLLSILRESGSDEYESELVADHLVQANLSGHDSHGAGMLPTYIHNLKAGLLKSGTSASLVSDNGSILIFDGQRGYGQRVAVEAMDAGIERCRSTGLTIVALRNAHHIGRVGAYGERCAAAGLVSLHFVNVIDHAPLVAPFGSREARLATNPLCMALPATSETPAVILDMATSKVSLGKARVAMNRGEQFAPGLLLDSQGDPTTEPGVMFTEPRGALLPLGEHKGYGLAFFCELLAGVLTGGGTIQPERPRLGSIINNMLTFLVDPRRLVEHSWMETEINAIVRYMKESRPVGIDVMVAGDPERKKMEERRELGVFVDDTTWEELLKAGCDVGLNRQLMEIYAHA